MARKILHDNVKLQVKAGEANPAPPIGPTLGQYGVNIVDFCKQFNDRTKDVEKGLVLPVVLTVFADRTFSFVIKTPPAAVLLKKFTNIAKGSQAPNKDKVGKVSKKDLEEIAKMKLVDLTASDLDAAVRSVTGTAKSMGLEVEEENI